MKQIKQNFIKIFQPPMTYKEYLLRKELSHQDTFCEKTNIKLYKKYLKKHEQNFR
jgi:hypothetical protein